MKCEDILQAIDRLEESGITFFRGRLWTNIPHPCGGQDISLEKHELQEFLEDKDAAIAKRFGVTKDHYRRWKEFIWNPQCSAATRKGTQCQHHISQTYLVSEMHTPDRFDSTASYFCTIHSEHAERPKVYRNPYS